MFGSVDTSAIVGIDGRRVMVEADYGDGLPSFEMVGFLGSEVKEARERVKAALKNSNIMIPPGRLTINLSPANLRKQGNSFDLPIALSIAVSVGILPQDFVNDYLFIGELSLDGAMRPVNGTLSSVLLAREMKKKGIVVPKENAKEAAVFQDLAVFGFSSLKEVMDFILSPEQISPEPLLISSSIQPIFPIDFKEVLGQESVKRAAAVASAGMHGFLMIGPPGSGKTLTAKRIPTILPPLTEEEQIECTKIHSVAGTLNKEDGLVKMRPFRSPHHTISGNALVGGGTVPRPGEMSLAHNGVLFLDELPEFSKVTLEVMRQPLEDYQIVVSRVYGTFVFPSRVMLVAAMNPCKCGYYPDRNRCHCSEVEVKKYLSKISKPLLDRIDISIEVPQVSIRDLKQEKVGKSSEEMRLMVIKAWEIQNKRFEKEPFHFNSEIPTGKLRTYCRLNEESEKLMADVFEKLELSARAHDRILKVARTIADIEGEEDIQVAHLAEAISYREIDRKFWRGDLS